MLDFREDPTAPRRVPAPPTAVTGAAHGTADAPLTVSQFTWRLKSALENNFSAVTLVGEISNATLHNNGHFYFSLKDDGAVIAGVMWRGAIAKQKNLPRVGERIIVGGKISVYEPRGAYQIVANYFRPDGAGAARAALEALIAQLRNEGLLAPERKKPLPLLPLTIGLVTGINGAAVHDMIKIIRHKRPAAKIILAPCVVQGVGAPADIVRALRALDASNLCEVIIVGRGGGSAEDLAAFNDERVARAVAACAAPIISAVGHEIDNSVCDLVADIRAATPTNAADIATQTDGAALLAELFFSLQTTAQNYLARFRENTAALTRRLEARHPETILRSRQQRYDEASAALRRAGESLISRARQKEKLFSARLEALNPLAVLRRGFSVTLGADGKIIHRAEQARSGDALRIMLAEGEIGAVAR
jgi:exodeoxyribonuclease VII large subunit